jgi:GTP-binding protein Era
MKTKAGFVTIIGKPNVGKSTLMNRLLNEELSIVTPKPQTTRKRVLGILTTEICQIVFLDTPGILDPKYLLQEKLFEYITASSKDADILIFMITIGKLFDEVKIFEEEKIRKLISKRRQKKILVINKIDLLKQDSSKQVILMFERLNIFDRVIPISALNSYNIENLLDSLFAFLPEHPKYYPDDQLSDEPERFFVSEKIREKILELYHDEIPYSVEVVIEDFKERPKGKDYISAVIMVERESQKPIILGKNGSAIKKLGNISRKSIEQFLMREVYLELRVKVSENWRKNEKLLNRFGYSN